MTDIQLTDEELLLLVRALNSFQASYKLSDADLITSINAKSKLITAQNGQKVVEA